MKNKFYYKILFIGFLAVFVASCNKEKFSPVDMDDLNPDIPLTNSALDQWLKANFLDVYNAAVIYRYNRYYHEADRNVTPPEEDKVQPMMQTVLSGFVNPYKDVAGMTFMKVNMPKEWVLYGSTSYDAGGQGYAGTASGGVRVNLFGVNAYSNTPGFIKGRINTIHHEFVHIVNQRFPMPSDFAQITKSTYNGNWQSTNADSAHKWGYVSTYASQNPTEDYAETASSLLVSGQHWFENRVKTCPAAAGQTALRLKEQNVVNYFTNLVGVDFRALQKKMFLYMKDTINDPSYKFPQYINNNLYKTITINLDDNMYTTYGISPAFATAYNNFKTDMYNTNTTARYRLDNLQLRFETNTSLVVRATFTATGGSAANTTYSGDYSFSVAVNSTTGETTFTKIAQGTGTTFNNGNIFLTSFTNNITPFLTGSTFVTDWMPAPKDLAPNLVSRTAGFYSTANNANYFYGILATNL